MRAAVYHGPGNIRIEDVPDARIEDPFDVVVRMRTASMCGSDLYLYQGEVEELVAPGHTTLGHEICAEVIEVGSSVARFSPGDRVTFPYSVSCGTCFFCREGQTAHCQTSGGAIFGFGVAFGDLGGSQAEFVRVPLADSHLELMPEDIDDEAALFLSCNLPGAITAVEAADIQPTDTVAVIGCGPTGLLALELAQQRTSTQVLALDTVPFRLGRASGLGARAVAVGDDPVEDIVAEATQGRGVDKVVEFAGRGDAFTTAVRITRPGGTISGGGVYLEREHPVSLFDMFFKNLQIKLNGFANAKTAQWRSIQALQQGVIDPVSVVTHRVSLAELPGAAASFAAREEGFLKMVIRP